MLLTYSAQNHVIAAETAQVLSLVVAPDPGTAHSLRPGGVAPLSPRPESYFGDASRSDLLETAGIEHARLLIVAIDDRERALHMVEHVKKFHPNVWVLARAFDRGHGYQLREAGADSVVSETYHSALQLAGHALTAVGVHPLRAQKMTRTFLDSELAHEDELFDAWREIHHGLQFSPRYSELFMKLEETMSAAIQQDW